MEKISETERQKYSEIWQYESYSEFSPGHEMVPMFAEISGCKPGDTVLDAGCGSGKGGLALNNDHNLDVTFLDICSWNEILVPEARKLVMTKSKFIQAPLWDSSWIPEKKFKYGFCCDVMEHLPTEYTMLTIANLLRACDHVFLHIANFHDGFGVVIGKPLHLTVFPFLWWKIAVSELGEVLDSRDLINNSVFYMKGN